MSENTVRPLIIKKISGPRVTGLLAAEIRKAALAGRITLYHVAGRATGMFEGESTYGKYVGLTGEFIATPEGDRNKRYMSGVAYLPAVCHDMIAGGLGANPAPGHAVEFAYTIGAGPDGNSPVGFSYWAENLQPPAPTDSLTAIAAFLPVATPAIENAGKKVK